MIRLIKVYCDSMPLLFQNKAQTHSTKILFTTIHILNESKQTKIHSYIFRVIGGDYIENAHSYLKQKRDYYEIVSLLFYNIYLL